MTLIWSSHLHPSPIFDPKYKPSPNQGWKPVLLQGRTLVHYTVLGGKRGPYQLKLKLLTYTLETFIHLILRSIWTTGTCRNTAAGLLLLQTKRVWAWVTNIKIQMDPNITQIYFYILFTTREWSTQSSQLIFLSVKQSFSPIFKLNGCGFLSVCKCLTGLSYIKNKHDIAWSKNVKLSRPNLDQTEQCLQHHWHSRFAFTGIHGRKSVFFTVDELILSTHRRGEKTFTDASLNQSQYMANLWPNRSQFTLQSYVSQVYYLVYQHRKQINGKAFYMRGYGKYWCSGWFSDLIS